MGTLTNYIAFLQDVPGGLELKKFLSWTRYALLISMLDIKNQVYLLLALACRSKSKSKEENFA